MHGGCRLVGLCSSWKQPSTFIMSPLCCGPLNVSACRKFGSFTHVWAQNARAQISALLPLTGVAAMPLRECFARLAKRSFLQPRSATRNGSGETVRSAAESVYATIEVPLRSRQMLTSTPRATAKASRAAQARTAWHVRQQSGLMCERLPTPRKRLRAHEREAWSFGTNPARTERSSLLSSALRLDKCSILAPTQGDCVEPTG